MQLKKVLDSLRLLTDYERHIVFQKLKPMIVVTLSRDDISKEICENKFTKDIMSPHCKSENTMKHGKYKKKTMLIKSCLNATTEIFRSIRFSKFTYLCS